MGQAKKQRLCPAAGRSISAAECGEHRHGRYACPAECAFNPFAVANYDALLALEGPLDTQTLVRAIDGDAGVRQRIERAANARSGHALHATATWELFLAQAADESTVVGRWAAAGFPGWRNDEATLLRGKLRTRVALLEVRAVLDDRRFDAVDLLDPESPVLRFVDKSMARQAGRFFTFLAWIYPLPHFWRTSGTAFTLPECGPHPAVKVVRECAAHLGGPAEPTALRRWLAENFVRMEESITATMRARREAMLRTVDAQSGVATYDLLAPWSTLRAVLLRAKTVQPDDVAEKERAEGAHDALVVFEAGAGAAATIRGRRVVGRLVATATTLRAEAIGAARLASLRGTVETKLGARVRFAKERRDDLGARLAAAEPAVDPALVPPELLRGPLHFELSSSRLEGPPPGMAIADYQAQLLQRYRRDWLDLPLPALDGATPRAAAGDFLLRPRLVEIAKTQVRLLDRKNLRTGRRDDVDELLRELGLDELCLPPLPPGAPVAPVAPDADDEYGFDGGLQADGDDDLPGQGGAGHGASGRSGTRAPGVGRRPDPGPLPAQPLTRAQVLERIDVIMDGFDSAEAALERLDAECPGLIERIGGLMEDWLSDEEFSFLVPFVLQAWFGLVPANAAPDFRWDAMAAAFRRHATELKGRDAAEAARMMEQCRQLRMLEALAGTLLTGAESMPKKLRPTAQGITGMVLVLRALIDEVDRALRE